jgi:hypothetical protein
MPQIQLIEYKALRTLQFGQQPEKSLQRIQYPHSTIHIQNFLLIRSNMYSTLPSYSIISVFSLLAFVTAVPYSNSIVAIPAQSTTVSSETGTADSPPNATPEHLSAPSSDLSKVEGIASPSTLAPDLHWTALGDSWASGVTYEHDPNLDWTAPRDPNCRRILDAYSVQLFNDTTWSGVRKQVRAFISIDEFA